MKFVNNFEVGKTYSLVVDSCFGAFEFQDFLNGTNDEKDLEFFKKRGNLDELENIEFNKGEEFVANGVIQQGHEELLKMTLKNTDYFFYFDDIYGTHDLFGVEPPTEEEIELSEAEGDEIMEDFTCTHCGKTSESEYVVDTCPHCGEEVSK